jgi:hypothetical protein
MGHLGGSGYYLYCLSSPIHTLTHHPHLLSLCSGLNDPWSLGPNTPIMTYLHHHYESDSNTELIRMQQRLKAYQVIGDELYKTLVT